MSKIVTLNNSLQNENPRKWMSLYDYDETSITEVGFYSGDITLPYQGAALFSPDGKYVFVSGAAHSNDFDNPLVEGQDSAFLFKLNGNEFELLDSYSPIPGTYCASINARWSRSGKYIGVSYTSNVNTSLVLLKVENDKLVEVRRAFSGGLARKCDFSADDRFIIYGSAFPQNLHVYRRTENGLLRNVNNYRIGRGMAGTSTLNHDDSKLLVTVFSNTNDFNALFLCRFNKFNGNITELDSIPINDYAWEAQFSPDGKYALVVSRSNPRITVVEVKDDSFGNITYSGNLSNRAMGISIDADNNVFVSIRAASVAIHYFKLQSDGTLKEIDTAPGLAGGPHIVSVDVLNKPAPTIDDDRIILDMIADDKIKLYSYNEDCCMMEGLNNIKQSTNQCIYLHEPRTGISRPVKLCEFDDTDLYDYYIYVFLGDSTRPSRISAKFLWLFQLN